MHQETSFVSLLIVITLATLVPIITTQMRRFPLPVVVGEVIAGMIFGKSFLNVISQDPWLDMLSTLGFAYLMFLSGLEVDFDAVIDQVTEMGGSWRKRLRSPIVLAVLSFVITLVGAFGLSFLLKVAGMIEDALFVALILSTTSLGLVVPVLKERGELRERYGQALLLASLIADFVTMLLISIYAILHTHGLTFDVLLVLVLLGAFLTVYRVLLRMQRHPPLADLFQRVADATSHMPIRAAFAIAMAFIALAEQLGIEAILGAFIGGAMIALLSPQDDTPFREKLDTMGYGFFIPFFFIMVGVRFDLPALLASPEALLFVPILLVIAYTVKIVASLVFRLNFSWRQTLGGGVLLASHLSLVIAAAAIGQEMGAIGPNVNAAIVLLAIITCTLSPILFNRIAPPPPRARVKPILVVGYDSEALDLSKRLLDQGDNVLLVLPSDAPWIEPPSGIHPIRLKEIRQRTLSEIGGRNAKTLVALLHDDESNLRVCQIATASLRIPNVVARVVDPTNTEAYAAAGANPVTLEQARATVLENLSRSPNVFQLLSHSTPNQEVVELTVENPELDGIPIHKVQLPGSVVIMVLKRYGTYLPARGNTTLQLHDVVTVLASPDEREETCRLFYCSET